MTGIQDRTALARVVVPRLLGWHRMVGSGMTPDLITRVLAESLDDVVRTRMASGHSIEHALRHAGVRDPGRVATQLARTVVPWTELAVNAVLPRAMDFVLYTVVIDAGGIADVPDPECLARELDGIDDPTEDDIDRAYAACSKRTIDVGR
jgi:hypothetical protein